MFGIAHSQQSAISCHFESFSCLLPSASKTHSHIVPLTKPVMLIVLALGLGGYGYAVGYAVFKK